MLSCSHFTSEKVNDEAAEVHSAWLLCGGCISNDGASTAAMPVVGFVGMCQVCTSLESKRACNSDKLRMLKDLHQDQASGRSMPGGKAAFCGGGSK